MVFPVRVSTLNSVSFSVSFLCFGHLFLVVIFLHTNIQTKLVVAGRDSQHATRPKNNEEPCVGRSDRRLGDAGSIHASRVLHRRGGQSNRARAP